MSTTARDPGESGAVNPGGAFWRTAAEAWGPHMQTLAVASTAVALVERDALLG